MRSASPLRCAPTDATEVDPWAPTTRPCCSRISSRCRRSARAPSRSSSTCSAWPRSARSKRDTDVVREGEVGDEFFLVAQGDSRGAAPGPPGRAARSRRLLRRARAVRRRPPQRDGLRRLGYRPSRCSTAPISTRHSTTSRRSAIHSCAAWPDASTSSTDSAARSANICSTSARAAGSLNRWRARGTTAAKRPPDDTIVVRGAREHNLKNVDLVLPRDRLIVFTGLSGSGKSSLAFDTIYAEGQRRYVESLSAYARQFLGQMDKPDVDFIEGLSPAISIDQKSASRNPRSTVGTITEIYDYLRLLYARIGVPHCPNCGRLITRQTPQQIVDRVLQLADGTRFQVLAPVVRGRKGEYSGLLDELAGQGFTRARVDGELDRPARQAAARAVREPHDRGRRRPAGAPRRHRAPPHRLARDRAALAEGVAEVEIVAREDEERGRDAHVLRAPRVHALRPVASTSSRRATSRSTRPTARARRATGSARKFQVDPELVIADDDLSIDEGAIAPWSGFRGEYFKRVLQAVGDEYGFTIDTPWKKLKARAEEGDALRQRRQDADGALQEPVRPAAPVHDQVRRRDPVGRAAPHRVRVRPGARGHRGLHAPRAVSRVRAARG